jgi:hypothetical protein
MHHVRPNLLLEGLRGPALGGEPGGEGRVGGGAFHGGP